MLYPSPCPAGYDLVPTGQQQGGLECQCEQNNKLIINCEDDQDSVIVEVYNIVSSYYQMLQRNCVPLIVCMSYAQSLDEKE